MAAIIYDLNTHRARRGLTPIEQKGGEVYVVSIPRMIALVVASTMQHVGHGVTDQGTITGAILSHLSHDIQRTGLEPRFVWDETHSMMPTN